MTKEEFKKLFEECYDISLSTGWNESATNWCLSLHIVDKDSRLIVIKSEIPTRKITE